MDLFDQDGDQNFIDSQTKFEFEFSETSKKPTTKVENNNNNNNNNKEQHLFSLQLENQFLKQKLEEYSKIQIKKDGNTGDVKNSNNKRDKEYQDIDRIIKNSRFDKQYQEYDSESSEEEESSSESEDEQLKKRKNKQQQRREDKIKKPLLFEKVDIDPKIQKQVDEELEYIKNFFKRLKGFPQNALVQSQVYFPLMNTIGEVFSVKVKRAKLRKAEIEQVASSGIRSTRVSKRKHMKNYLQGRYNVMVNNQDGSEVLSLESIVNTSADPALNILEPTIEEVDVSNIPANPVEMVDDIDVDKEKLDKLLSMKEGELGDDKKLPSNRKCHICRKSYQFVHFFYDSLCWACSQLNYSKRFNTAELDGRVAIVTGSRIKIGYQCALKLLRAGATVIATTRFPKDSSLRYIKEPDFEKWKDRLHIYALNLCDLRSVELFCDLVQQKFKSIDMIVNNAAQTIKRPTAYFEDLYKLEANPTTSFPQETQSILSEFEKHKHQYLPNSSYIPSIKGTNTNNSDSKYITSSTTTNIISEEEGAVTSSIIKPIFENLNNMIDKKEFDEDGLPIDKRDSTSWVQKVYQISPLELLETHAISSFSPFIILSNLFHLLKNAADLRGSAYVINVNAMEGKFSRFYKSANHPHTNMAKASQNMLTRTSSVDLAQSNIYMNSVDTGWITDERPFELSKKMKDPCGLSWEPPLDEIDAAARVLDPIWEGINTQKPQYGFFYKNYRPINW
ncbi:hypothetical protein CYY_002242 [Polysphondylium violaceum]|uniref:Oxidoreductase n=1 Tax=Polysphondylium violaceum TaxID=133409 RepID=A0A8J4V9S9_9MYCE|nr:hypothetical protein CYY_002242 [Polysphondylium violaceum]